MTISEAERRLKIEREILRLLGELGQDDVQVWNRVCFQLANVGELERFVMMTKMREQP